jgi:hypothetical protein
VLAELPFDVEKLRQHIDELWPSLCGPIEGSPRVDVAAVSLWMTSDDLGRVIRALAEAPGGCVDHADMDTVQALSASPSRWRPSGGTSAAGRRAGASSSPDGPSSPRMPRAAWRICSPASSFHPR